MVDGVLVADGRTHGIQLANPAICEMTGYSEAELLALTVEDIHPADGLPEILNRMESLREGMRRSVLNIPLLRKDGSVLFVDINASLIRLDGDELILGVFRDAKERRDAESALRRKTEELDQYFMSSLDLLCIADTDGYFQQLNPEWERTLGYSVESLIGTRFLDLVHPEDVDATLQAVADLNAQVPVQNFVNRYRHRDGNWRWIEWRSFPIENLIYATARDITERKVAEENLNRTQKLESIGVLAGGIAHDFNNLLSGIFGNIDLALMTLSHENCHAAQRVLQSAMGVLDRARDLTGQLMTFSKGGAPNKQFQDLKQTVRETAEFVLRGSSVKPLFDFSSDLWACAYDAHQMSQVIENLVINAKQAMPEGGIVSLRIVNHEQAQETPGGLQPGRYVCIEISDRGIGIPRTNLSKIFDPFFSTKQEGSGLGLATSWSVVNRHMGFLDVESDVGRGAKFNIYLPASDTDQTVRASTAVGKSPRGFGRILIMDDEPYIRDVLSRMLQSLGYEVTSVSDAEEAVDVIRTALVQGNPFACAVLDLTIPGGMGGRDALVRLKEIQPGIRAVASSGYADDPVMASPESFGFAASLKKPYRMAAAAEVLRTALSGNWEPE